ncbi:MAG: maltose ABC transporter permease MalG [Spartobacteria bacterium]|nr:maltose ABC transporter permease MalG [Spartobacteria bacterium]
MIKSKHHKLHLFLAYACLVGFIALTMFPFLMIISISFRQGNLALGSLIPKQISLEHWKFVLGLPYADADGNIVQQPSVVLQWFWNSIKVASISSIMILLLSGSGAYAFARLRFRFRGEMLTSLMILQMFPQVLSLVAIYAILNVIGNYIPSMGLNTHPGLILVYLGGVAIYIWMIKGYFDTIPASIEESAMIDGATTFQTFIGILLPMSLPIFAVVFILSFISYIGEYPVASVCLTQTDQWTLAVGANSFLYDQNYLWGRFAATAVLSGIPISVMFLVCQKFLVSGLTSGGVKG